MKSRTAIAVSFALVLIGVIATVLIFRFQYTAYVPVDYKSMVTRWQARFATEDVSAAYVQFVREGNTLSPDKAHTLAHIIGALLYDKKGLDGLTYCTADFNYGCYHGFAGRVIELHGTSGVEMLLDTCAKLSVRSECEHGLGHGILAYLGDGKLSEALGMCPPYTGTDVSGCHSGVFMEYLLDTLRRDEGGQPLPVTTEEPERPCNVDIPDRFRSACYYVLPSWWRAWSARDGADYTTQFTLIGKRCGAISDATLRKACFLGAGALIAPFSGFTIDRAKEWCALMPVNGQTWCLSEATNAVDRARKRIPVPNTASPLIPQVFPL